ncbi:MAG: IS30 family transposase [bacterium]|jgi:IS30 family transposase
MKGYHHLSYKDRVHIELRLRDKWSIRKIAGELGYSPSTISREYRRNQLLGNRYIPEKAHHMARNRERGRPKKKIRPGTAEYVFLLSGIERGWSFEQISGRLSLEYPGRKLSHETIYRFIQFGEEKALGAWEYLTWQRRRRKHRTGRRKGKRTTIPNRIGIEQRPAWANDRSEFGHFECDLICFSRQRGVILNLVERKTRFGWAELIPNKEAQGVINALVPFFRWFNSNWPGAAKSVTFDNGTEFTMHADLKNELSIDTYFCHPYSSWERGTVERSNGTFRRYTPRKTLLSTLTQEELFDIRMEMNHHPLKLLSWRSPAMAIKEELLLCSYSPAVALRS